MQARLDPFKASPASMQAMLAFEQHVQGCGLEKSLIELVKTRSSQINGCAYCLHMHTKDAPQRGETEERLYVLSAWRDSSLYTEGERAALTWTEALTSVRQTHASDTDYELLGKHFSDEEKVQLTLLICAINSWNRIAIGFRSVHPT